MSTVREKRKSVSSLFDDLGEHWLSNWQRWFANLRTSHEALSALIDSLSDLDEEFLLAVRTARASGGVSQANPEDNRFVRVNFGGQKCLTLRRDHLLGPHIKHNFFCALFDPRWQVVLPKDKEGRIYLDINYGWVKPLLEEINRKVFAAKCEEAGSTQPMELLGRSHSLFREPWALQKLWGLKRPFPSAPTPAPSPAPVFGFNGVSPNPHPFMNFGSQYRPPSTSISIQPSFGMVFHPSEPKSQGSLLQFAEAPTLDGKIAIPKTDISELSCDKALASFSKSLQSANKELELQLKKCNDFLKFKVTEAWFIGCLLQDNGWRRFVRTEGDQFSTLKPMHEIEYFHEFVDKHTNMDLLELTRASYLNIAAHASPAAQALKTNNIVTFNVDGESVSVLRSSISSAVPGSQLAIRVSEDWVEQESTMDDEGRLIVDFPLGVFLPLIDYIRAVGLLGVDYVSKELIIHQSDLLVVAKNMLQYLVIPNLEVKPSSNGNK